MLTKLALRSVDVICVRELVLPIGSPILAVDAPSYVNQLCPGGRFQVSEHTSETVWHPFMWSQKSAMRGNK